MFHFSRLIALLIVLLIGLDASAGTIKNLGVDTLLIQDPSSSADPKIQLDGTSYIKKNKSTGKLSFSHDGVVEKNIGSGSGSGDGGASVLPNGSFEDGISIGYTTSGGTFSQGTYTNGIEGDLKYAQLAASTSGQYFETTATAIPDFSVGGCLAKIDYNSTDASGTWRLQVYDGSSNLLADQGLDPKAWQPGYAPFKCPPIGTLIKLRVISTASGNIQADRAYLGKENRTFQVAQAKLAGVSFFPATSGCTPQRGSTALGPLTTSAACVGPTIVESSMGQWQTTDVDNLKQTINNLPAGKYEASFEFWQYVSSSADVQVSIFDGTSFCTPIPGAPTTSAFPSKVSCVFTYTAAGTRSFEIYTSSSANTVILRADTVNAKFTLKSWPTDSETALRPDSQDWFVDVNIGGNLISLGSTSPSSFTEVTDTTLDMVINTGSVSAKIPCSSTNPSAGLTCPVGNEGVGVVFTPPQAGWYEVCADFSHGANTAASTNVATTFELVETAASSQTILQEGRARTADNTNSNASNYYPHHNCGWFKFDSSTERTVRLMYEQLASGTISTNTIPADRNASIGQRDIRIVVRPLLSSYSRPYLVGDQIIRKFSSELATFSFSSTYTASTLPSAPIGTYIAFTGGASAQCTTQMSTGPTNQTDAQKTTDGILLVSKVFTAASTAGVPCRYDIQIGKDLKGYSIATYTGAAKTGNAVDLDFFTNGGGIDVGAFQSYNPATGILSINTGFAWSSNTTRWLGILTDGTTTTTGYAVIQGWGN